MYPGRKDEMKVSVFKVSPKDEREIEFSKDLGAMKLSVKLHPAQTWIARNVMYGIEVNRPGHGFRLTLTRSAFDQLFKIG